MADIDIGRALSGLGAAFKNEMPAFIQQTRQEDALALQQSEFERKRLLQDEALAEKRRKTMFQDAAAASSLLDSGDYRGIADLMEDRITILGPTGADTSHSNEKRTLALRASVGDQRAIGELKRLIANEVGIGYSTGMITRPVDRSTTLSKDQVVYNSDGTIRFDNRGSDKTTQRQREISALSAQLKANGTPNFENVATNIVDGLITIEFSDDGTSANLTDRTKLITDPENAVTSIRIATPERPEEEPPVGGSLFELVGQEGSLGGVAGTAKFALRELANQFGFDPYAEDSQGIQRLNAAGMGLINSLRQGGRYIQGETNMIKDEIGDLSPSLFTTDIEIENKMISLDSTLRERLNTARTNANDPRLGKEERSQHTVLVNNLEDFLRLMGVPVGSGSGSSVVTIPAGLEGDAIYESLPSGTRYNDGNVTAVKP